jgi:hypothetical protein
VIAVRGGYELYLLTIHKWIENDEHSVFQLKPIQHFKFNSLIRSCCFSSHQLFEMCCVVDDGTVYLWEGAANSTK